LELKKSEKGKKGNLIREAPISKGHQAPYQRASRWKGKKFPELAPPIDKCP